MDQNSLNKMTTYLIVSVVVYFVLASFASAAAKQRNALFWSDILAPVAVVVFWVILTFLGYGEQSLGNLIEIPMALFIMVGLFYVRLYFLDKRDANYQYNSYTVLGAALVAVLALRSFMPLLEQ
ncbi:MAG: hypothetical protein U9N30_06845 [Campylobacterota bacterium]|nr:hypothetical protein [Campylobacterota bacterium]